MYFSNLSLPQYERFKAHSIILIGMIPGPNEPSNLNPFLAPLVSDLNRLFTCVYVQQGSSLPIRLRAIVVCIVYDLPATRKLCGFLNFNAFIRCSKCLKEFPTEHFGLKLFIQVMLYMGFPPVTTSVGVYL